VRVAVTGAGGFVGHAVTTALHAAGHDVLALTRRSPVDVPGVAVRVGELDAGLAAVLADVDAVCHLAAAVQVRASREDPIGTWRTNLDGTLAVLDALVRAGRGARLVLASTAAVYGEVGPVPVREDHPTAPTHPYGASKLAADLAARDVAATGAVGAVSLRAFNIAGACAGRGDADPSRLVSAVLDVAAGTRPEFVVNGDGSATRDFLHVLDAADAFVAALDACTPGTWRAFHLGSGRPVSVREVVDTAARVTGRAIPVRHRPAAAEPASLVADARRARDELGWVPRRSSIERIVSDAWTARAP
jgi:UDP-glucose 4-epimerase